MSRRGWALFAALSVCWGVPYLFIRIAVVDLDPVVVAWGRTTLGALVLLPLALHRRVLRPVVRAWRPLLIYTAVEIIGPWVLLGHAETRLNSSTTGLVIAVVPLVAAIILVATGTDRFGTRRLLGLVLGFAGAAALVGLDVRLDDAVAVGQLLLVVIGYATGPILIARFLSELPSLGVVTASLIIAAVAYSVVVPFAWPDQVRPAAVGSVVVLALVCTVTAFLVMFALIAEAGPARMTLITYVNPAVAVLLGAVVLNEPLTTGLAVGFPLIILGSILGTWRNRPPAPAAAAMSLVPGAGLSEHDDDYAGDERLPPGR